MADDWQDLAGWSSSFPVFHGTPRSVVRDALRRFISDADESQVRAWTDSIPKLQQQVKEVLELDPLSPSYTTILEYKLPLESRRADVIFLLAGGIVVVELKGKPNPTQADLDQALGYARDLRAYHRECIDLPAHAVLVPTRSDSPPTLDGGVWIVGPDHLDQLLRELTDSGSRTPNATAFLDDAAYRPLPSLVQAARELFHSRTLRSVWRARAATDPAVEYISQVAHAAAQEGGRHLVLVTGEPGAGKTLVGMRCVHAKFLDDLAEPRVDGVPTAPAILLSGNQPLVEVLQYVLRGSGGGGKVFVRHMKDYLNAHAPKPHRIPAEHVLVFDEAQRAFTADKVAEIHPRWPKSVVKSEPELFAEIAERIPRWSIVVGLIGTGQEIHSGEDGGVTQWRRAVEGSSAAQSWQVHVPPALTALFQSSSYALRVSEDLHLDRGLRFHVTSAVTEIVEELLSGDSAGDMKVAETVPVYARLLESRYRLWITRDLEQAKAYMRDVYADRPEARFGILASSRDKLLQRYGVGNDYQTTKRTNVGAWFAEGADSPLSCRHLEICATEFQAQGLELDMALVAWGSDLIRAQSKWSIEHSRKYLKGRVSPRDPFQLRLNAYRVLLTRGRDGAVIFVPKAQELEETWVYFKSFGLSELT